MPITVTYQSHEAKQDYPGSAKQFNPAIPFQKVGLLVEGSADELKGFYKACTDAVVKHHVLSPGTITVQGFGESDGSTRLILSVPYIERRVVSSDESLYGMDTESALRLLKHLESQGFAFAESPDENASYIKKAQTGTTIYRTPGHQPSQLERG